MAKELALCALWLCNSMGVIGARKSLRSRAFLRMIGESQVSGGQGLAAHRAEGTDL